ncbi:beta-microseminoprotein [Grammomys surdaster]|uniref:beta-microseminoprotein n=1 Tax=Grammomys surdaster TaxID=491861 RepID=UPI0010A02805|nr:beta-microseminoprotein [Grammomys surdaster]
MSQRQLCYQKAHPSRDATPAAALELLQDLQTDQQKAWLGSLLFLATLVIPSKAGCTIENRERLPNQKYDECVDANGGKHFLNTTWKKEECAWCFCGKTAITAVGPGYRQHCCHRILTQLFCDYQWARGRKDIAKPVKYDKEKCSKQFHPENCTYSVVERTTPGKTCQVKSWTM